MTEPIKVRLAIEGAELVQAGANKAAQGLERFGQASQKAGQQTQLSGYQMQQVSNQLQDFFIQVQSGQSVLTAFAQQGSQLGAVFGGFGNAARALGGLLSPTVAILGTAAVTVGALAVAYKQGAAESEAYTRALVLSGNAAGVTVGQLQAMAKAQSGIVGTQGAAAEALAALAATGKLAGDSLSTAAEAAVRLARVGVPLEDTIKKFADLGKDPLKSVIQLNEAENFLTVSVYKQIKALQEQGRTAEAAKLAVATYASVGKERAAELEASLGTLQRTWIKLGDEAKAAWDKILNVGRPNTLSEQIKGLEADRARLQAAAKGTELAGFRQWLRDFKGERSFADQAKDLDPLIARLKESEAMSAKVAATQAQQAAATKVVIKADEDAAKAKAKLTAEMDREAAALERAIGLSGSYYKDLADLGKLREKGKLTEEQYVAQVQKLINAQPVVREQVQAETEARRAAQKVLDDQAKAYERTLEAQYRVVGQVDEHIQKLRDEEAAIAVAADKNISLAAAVELVTAARVKESMAKADASGDYLTAAALQAEIDKRKELAALINSKDARDSAKKAAEEATREWRRSANEIERSLTDALMRGFESGKGFAITLRDTLVNMFKTLVLRPVIQAIVQPVAGGLLGGFGTSALAAAGPASSALSGLVLLGSLGLSPWLLGAGAGIFGGRAISGGLSAIGSSGNTSVNLGTAIGAAIGGPLGAALGGALGGVVNRAFGMGQKEARDSGITGTIGGGDVSGQSFQDWFQKGGWFRSNKSGTNFGAPGSELEAGLDLGAQAILANTRAWANALQLPAEQLASITSSFKTTLTGNADADQKAIAAVLQGYSDALTTGFAAQLSPFVKSGETAAQTLERLAASITGVNGVLGVLGQSLLAGSVSGADSAAKLLEQFGGLQPYQSAAGQYLQDYYSESERAALATQQLTAQLASVGVTLPQSRDAYRGLIEAQDLNTDAGRRAYAALVQLAPQFAALTPAVQGLGTAAQEAARLAEEAAARQVEAGRRVLADLARQQGDLQVQLLTAQGNTAAAAALARQQALASLTEGLSAQDAAAAAAAYDFNAALQQQITALTDAATAARVVADAEAQRVAAVASQRDGIQAQIDQLLGNTAALRARELAGLDESNRALQGRYYALLDERAAADLLAQSSADAARAAEQLAAQQTAQQAAIARERDGIQAQIDQLLGNTTAIRARELAGLDESNRALQERYYALQDERTAQAAAAQAAAEAARAADEQARAAEQLRQAWQNIGTTIAEEVARIRGLNTGSSANLTAEQARFAIVTAQARAGDQDAARLLPQLSRTVLDLAAESARSKADLERARAQVAASLEGTAGVIGSRYGYASTSSGLDVQALVQQAAATAPIVSAAVAPVVVQAAADSASSVLAERLAAMEEKFDAIRAATERTRDLLSAVTRGGDAMQTEVV